MLFRSIRTRAERYQALRAAVSEVVVLTHADGSVIDLPEWCKVTGQKIAEISQAHWLDALHDDDRAAGRMKWDEAKRLRTPFEIEARIQSAQGAYRWVIARGAPVTGEEGIVREWIFTLARRARHEGCF